MKLQLELIFYLTFVFVVCFQTSSANDPINYEVQVLSDVSYRTDAEQSVYETERCRLDVYLPQGKENFATLIWFHGGGLKNGDKNRLLPNDSVTTALIAKSLARTGIAVVAPNYWEYSALKGLFLSTLVLPLLV